MLTIALAAGVLGIVIYAIGFDTTRTAASTAGGGAKRVATSSAAAGAAGVGLGLQFGNELFQLLIMDPFAGTTVLAGVAGALGIGGYLGGITMAQFLLIGVGITGLVAIWRY
ncbi:hypothetical protein DVK02_12890 [Halobellus sp. Atlit-31R]|nr:hypothetical protein DVK02_12890 [Halobellus sp. Atlit-31R]